MQLAYHQKITGVIPKTLAALMPCPPEPHMKYLDEEADLPGHEAAVELQTLMRQRKSVQVCIIVLSVVY